MNMDTDHVESQKPTLAERVDSRSFGLGFFNTLLVLPIGYGSASSIIDSENGESISRSDPMISFTPTNFLLAGAPLQ